MLEPSIKVILVPRYEVNGQVITATKVRQLIKDDNLLAIQKLVPSTTMDFIKNNKEILQDRIKKGMNIDGN